MIHISNSDFEKCIRLVDALARRQGTNRMEREESRKATLLSQKLKRLLQVQLKVDKREKDG